MVSARRRHLGEARAAGTCGERAPQAPVGSARRRHLQGARAAGTCGKRAPQAPAGTCTCTYICVANRRVASRIY